MPKKWVPYEKDFYSIGGASGDALAMCYRIETKNPAEPRKRCLSRMMQADARMFVSNFVHNHFFLTSSVLGGCYFKQPTSGNGRCGGPFLTWTADNHGRKNLWSWENEALCLQRKTEHDDYCGTNTTWMFVPNRADQAFTGATPRVVSERLTWLLKKDFRFCEKVPYRRRLQAQADYMREFLGRRKVVIAPYKGEVRELMDMVTVEALLAAFEDALLR
eukprot:g32148.t1